MRVMGELGGLGVLGVLGVLGELGVLGVLGGLGELGGLESWEDWESWLPHHQNAALWRYAARQIRLGFSFIGLFVWFLRLGRIF